MFYTSKVLCFPTIQMHMDLKGTKYMLRVVCNMLRTEAESCWFHPVTHFLQLPPRTPKQDMKAISLVLFYTHTTSKPLLLRGTLPLKNEVTFNYHAFRPILQNVCNPVIKLSIPVGPVTSCGKLNYMLHEAPASPSLAPSAQLQCDPKF